MVPKVANTRKLRAYKGRFSRQKGLWLTVRH
jgi:hypothetical protein